MPDQTAGQNAQAFRDRLNNVQTTMANPGMRQGSEEGLELGVAARNLIPSLKRNLGDIVSAIGSPIDTTKGLLSVAGGFASKAGVPGLSDFEPYADALNEMIVDRYGGVDNVLNTIETDPVGVLMDFSGISGVGGKLAKMSGFEKTGDLIQAAGRAVDPVGQTVNLGSALLSKIPESIPENLYAGGAKPGTTLTPDERRSFNRTAVEEGIMPNDAGLAKFEALKAGLNDQIDNLIDQSVDTGKAVDATVLFDELEKLKLEIREGGSIDRVGDLEEIAKVEQKLMQSIYGEEAADWGVTFPKPLTARELQRIKVDAYNRSDYGRRTQAPDLANTANQAVGRAARMNIEGITSPQIANVNQQLGKLYDMQQPLERAVNRIDQRNAISLPQTIGAASGYGGGGVTGGLAGLALGGLLTPTTQARLGIGLERMRNMTPGMKDASSSLLRGSAYSGRARQGLQNRGLLGY